jgi:hypothetical protein
MDYLVNHPSSSPENIVVDFLDTFIADASKPKEWYYYYVKYENCRKWGDYPTDGFYRWNNGKEIEPYNFFMMYRKQRNGRHWSPFLLTLKELFERGLELDDFGEPMTITAGRYQLKMLNHNDRFELLETDEESTIFLSQLRTQNILDGNNCLKIMQNEHGLDIEDRVEKGYSLVQAIQSAQIIAEVL